MLVYWIVNCCFDVCHHDGLLSTAVWVCMLVYLIVNCCFDVFHHDSLLPTAVLVCMFVYLIVNCVFDVTLFWCFLTSLSFYNRSTSTLPVTVSITQSISSFKLSNVSLCTTMTLCFQLLFGFACWSTGLSIVVLMCATMTLCSQLLFWFACWSTWLWIVVLMLLLDSELLFRSFLTSLSFYNRSTSRSTSTLPVTVSIAQSIFSFK